jgi:hypothetical protein
VIVDSHTHIFPPEVLAHRAQYLAADTTFATLYGSVKAKLATAEDLLASMDGAGIDVSIALGFAWQDEATCRLHNDYLLEAAVRSNGRIVAFCTLPLAAGADAVWREARRCLDGGASGFGELRPESVGVDLGEKALASAIAEAANGRPLLFHVSEPVGHAYPGKEGLQLETFYEFVTAQNPVAIGAHWAGGLPFYGLMPEVRMSLAGFYVDTAGTSLLYRDSIYAQVAAEMGTKRILFGSDFPLLAQARSRHRIEASGLGAEAVADILGGNAAALLKLS